MPAQSAGRFVHALAIEMKAKLENEKRMTVRVEPEEDGVGVDAHAGQSADRSRLW
jgi:hypothetical protein